MQMKLCLVLALCGLATARTFRPVQEENGGRRQGQEASRRPGGQPREGQNAQRRQGGSIRPEAGGRVYQAFSNPSQVTLSQERYQGKPEAAPQRQLRPVEGRRQRPGREEQERRQPYREDQERQRPYREEQRPYQPKEVRRNFRPVVQEKVYEEPQILEPIRAAPVEDSTIRRFRPQQAQQEVQREVEVPRLEEVQRVERKPVQEVQRVERKPAQVEEQEAPVYRPKKQESPVYRPKKQEASVYRPKKQEAPVYRPKRERVPEQDSVAAPQGVDPVFERASVQAHHEFGGPAEQRDIESAVHAGAAAYSGEVASPQRLSFQIHGQEGPNSYRYGYDTGVGYNRQFKYEERNNYGVLHGRYGYYDQAGKLQVVNYTADPEKGFHAEGEHVPKLGY